MKDGNERNKKTVTERKTKEKKKDSRRKGKKEFRNRKKMIKVKKER